jgi:hypothetical protein
MKNEVIGMGYIQSTGIFKMTNIGMAYSLNVGVIMNTIVGNQQITKVGSNKSLTVGADYTAKIGSNATYTIGANRKETIGSVSVTKAGSHLEIACGAAKIVLDSGGGIYLTGTHIEMQGGGAINGDAGSIKWNCGAASGAPGAPAPAGAKGGAPSPLAITGPRTIFSHEQPIQSHGHRQQSSQSGQDSGFARQRGLRVTRCHRVTRWSRQRHDRRRWRRGRHGHGHHRWLRRWCGPRRQHGQSHARLRGVNQRLLTSRRYTTSLPRSIASLLESAR